MAWAACTRAVARLTPRLQSQFAPSTTETITADARFSAGRVYDDIQTTRMRIANLVAVGLRFQVADRNIGEARRGD